MVSRKKQGDVIDGVCGDCVHVTEVTEFRTLTVHGRKPTMGTCPYWKESRCVLLSQRACVHYRKRV